MAYIYTGEDPLIQELIAYINSENAQGRIVRNIYLESGSVEPQIFSPELQRRAIKSAPVTSGPRLIKSVTHASPRPNRQNTVGKGKDSFKAKIKRGEIVTTPYERFSFTMDLVFFPKPSRSSVIALARLPKTFGSVTWIVGETPKKYNLRVCEYKESTALSGPVYTYTGREVGDYRREPFNTEGGQLRSWHMVCHNHPAGTVHYLYNPNGTMPDASKDAYPESEIYLEVSDGPSIEPTPPAFPSFDFWDSCQFEDPDAIVKCMQRLDQAEADVLTTIAEMSKTIDGLASNVMRTTQWLYDMYRHARKGAVVEAVKTFESGLFTGGLDIGSKVRYRRKLRRLERARRKHANKLGRKYGHDGHAVERVNSHWLDAQYGVVPAVLSVQDIIDTISRPRPIFERRKVKGANGWKFPEEYGPFVLVSDSSDHGVSVWGKIKFDPKQLSVLNSLRQYGKFNPALTAWELIPLSFVIDWFLNIGDRLSTIDVTPGFEKVFMTSYKLVADASYEYDTPAGKYVLRITGSGYKRKYTALMDRFELKPSFDLSLSNYLTSFALIWNKAKGHTIPKGVLNG